MSAPLDRFSAASDTVAELTVAGATRAFSVHVDHALHTEIGFAEAPLFRIDRNPNPDDAWDIEPIEGGDRIRLAGEMASDAPSWVPPRHAPALSSLAAALPAGDYFLVRHLRHRPADSTVMLGNELVPDPPAHHRPIFDSGGAHYAGAVGQRAGEPPDLGHPLLGLSVLNFTGQIEPWALLFFSCFDEASADPDPDELLLIIPRTGPLVFDAMSHYLGHDSSAERARWAGEPSEAFAAALAGED